MMNARPAEEEYPVKHSSRTVAALFTALALTAAGCGSDDDSTAAPSTTENGDDSGSSTGSSSDLNIVAVDFAAGSATITNNGGQDVDLVGHQLCNRPTYVNLPDQTLAPGESIDVALGGLTQDGGEVGLYTSGNFGSSDDIVDYVTWGSGGGRLSVAEDAGEWSGAPAEASGDKLQLNGASGVGESWGS
jgi:hypothetical protein